MYYHSEVHNQLTKQPTKYVASVYWHTDFFSLFPSAFLVQSTANCCISCGISAFMISALHSDILVDLQQNVQHIG